MRFPMRRRRSDNSRSLPARTAMANRCCWTRSSMRRMAIRSSTNHQKARAAVRCIPIRAACLMRRLAHICARRNGFPMYTATSCWSIMMIWPIDRSSWAPSSKQARRTITGPGAMSWRIRGWRKSLIRISRMARNSLIPQTVCKRPIR